MSNKRIERMLSDVQNVDTDGLLVLGMTMAVIFLIGAVVSL